MVRVSHSLPDTLIIEKPDRHGSLESLLILDAFDILSGKLEAAMFPEVLRNSRIFTIRGERLCLNGGSSFRGRIEIEIGEALSITVRQFADPGKDSHHEPYIDPWDQSWGE